MKNKISNKIRQFTRELVNCFQAIDELVGKILTTMIWRFTKHSAWLIVLLYVVGFVTKLNTNLHSSMLMT